jgi:protein-tyrosine phosphatase
MYDFVGTDVHHHQHLETLQKIGTLKNLKSIKDLMKSTIERFGN